ncbi:hypothetical protein [Fusicatenibacter saccharivorans]|uniref:hypothetical protein n=1 Tax=Fusicatenibacter saccharivorans TaxID=1150298 RepID=UPI0032BF97F9
MKQKTPEQKLKGLCANIIRERNHWIHINEYGCNDPFWPDGCNMNLTRNHIISYRREIEEICEETGMALPEEYFLKVPPEVDNDYMANLKQKVRVERLKQQGDKLSRKKQKFVDDGQLEFC